MVFTDSARQFITWGLGSDVGLYIGYIGIGSGSGTALVTNEILLHEVNRQNLTGSPNFNTTHKVGFQTDFNSVQMSGIHLTEFGLFNIGSNGPIAGSVWQREAFGSIIFDGTSELQITTTLEVL